MGAAGRDVLCRSSRGDCVGQEGQEELAAFQGCSYTDPQSSRKSEVLNTRLSCALHWSQGWSKAERLHGMSYTLTYAEKKEKFDEVVQQDGATVLIDKKAQMSILGTEMDYAESKLASEFVFNNPNITGTCGCGESFSM